MIIQIISKKKPLRGHIAGKKVLTISVPESGVELIIHNQRYRIVYDKSHKKRKLVARHTVKYYSQG
jgi:hypothetical protein